MEGDGTVLGGGNPPVVVLAAPVVAGHGPHRSLHTPAVECVWSGVANDIINAVRAVALGCVPVRERARAQVLTGVHRLHLIDGERPVEDPAPVDLSVVGEILVGATNRCRVRGSAPHERGCCALRLDAQLLLDRAAVIERRHFAEPSVIGADDRLLVQKCFTGPRIK